MPIDRRRRTLEWARETGCIVVEHDWAGLVRYQGSTLPALQAHDVSDQVIYLGSFVEAVPAARMAYAIVPDPLMSRFRSVLGPLEAWPSPVEQRALAHFLDDGHLERHLRRLRVALWDRQVEVIEMLNHRIGQRISIRPAAAGGHVVIRLADDVVEGMRGVAARSAERGLLVSALADHALGATTDDALLFSFASHREVDLSRAMNVLARAIDDSAGASQPMSRLAWSGIRIR
jgi:GntR family transcriptional regulator/MocR family aminotransferase